MPGGTANGVGETGKEKIENDGGNTPFGFLSGLSYPTQGREGGRIQKGTTFHPLCGQLHNILISRKKMLLMFNESFGTQILFHR